MNYSSTSNEDRRLHSLHRLGLIKELRLVTQPPTITSSSTFSSYYQSSRRTRPKKSGGTTWQDSIYKPNAANSPSNEKEAMGRTSTRVVSSYSPPSSSSTLSSPRSVLVSSKEDQQQKPEQREPYTTKHIEVAPGEFLPLIGVDETRDAVREGRTVHTTCLVCSLSLVCANQADCVLCPSCRVVSPITDNSSRSSPVGKKRHYTFGGVGMGLSEREFLGLQEHDEQEALNNSLQQIGVSMSSLQLGDHSMPSL
jgi:hypothetical protein